MQHKLVGVPTPSEATEQPQAGKTFQKLTKLLLVALFCGVGGCDPWYSGWEYKYTITKVLNAGKISDTTAVLRMKTYDDYGYEGPGGGSEERNVEEYLALADIRFEKIYWQQPKGSVMDTIVEPIELWTPSAEYEWVNDCIAVKWSSESGLCLKENVFYGDILGDVFFLYKKMERLKEKI